MSSVYTVKPQADFDIEEYANYLVGVAGVDLALRFLASADETFSLLAEHPKMGWPARLKHPELKTLRVFRVAGFETGCLRESCE